MSQWQGRWSTAGPSHNQGCLDASTLQLLQALSEPQPHPVPHDPWCPNELTGCLTE